VTATTAGTGNVPVSILEDLVATGLSILAVVVPVLIAALIIVVTAFIVWWLWRRANTAQPA
jgi:Flp pilus assembly protein TadB